MPNLRNGSKGDSNPGSLDCESGILPLSYRVSCKCLLSEQVSDLLKRVTVDRSAAATTAIIAATD